MKRKIKNTIVKGERRTLPGKNASTSYDTSKGETSTPQKVREGNEASGEYARQKKAE